MITLVTDSIAGQPQDVLVLFGGRTFCVCSFWVGDGCGSTKPFWLHAMHHPDGTPTHWMPLPDLPAAPEKQP